MRSILFLAGPSMAVLPEYPFAEQTAFQASGNLRFLSVLFYFIFLIFRTNGHSH
jgi:hypothetical protein